MNPNETAADACTTRGASSSSICNRDPSHTGSRSRDPAAVPTHSVVHVRSTPERPDAHNFPGNGAQLPTEIFGLTPPFQKCAPDQHWKTRPCQDKTTTFRDATTTGETVVEI
ncbi:Uncharacterised protein r2_g2056 [Pycnogonum litorale]